MLAADKLQLQSSLKQQATALKEKEFNLHHTNLSKFVQNARVDGIAPYHILLYIQWIATKHSQSKLHYFTAHSDRRNAGSSIGWIGHHHVY
jgi:hypothetical protein